MDNREKVYKIIFISAFAFICILAALLVPKISENQKQHQQLSQSTPAPTQTSDIIAEVTANVSEPTKTPTAFVQTALIIDGERVGVLASREAAESCVEEIIAYYEAMIEEDSFESMETSIVNEISFEDAPDAKGIVTADALALLLTSSDSPVKIKVRSLLANTVLEAVRCTYEIIKDKYLVEGTRVVEVVGKDGQKRTTTNYTYENGKKSGAGEVLEETVTEAVNGVMRVGTMEKDMESVPSRNEGKEGKDKGNSSFSSPVSGSVINNYGQLNGVLNLGLDYSASEGSKVLASCDGTVVSVLERGGYELTVEIAHENGFLTRYALLGSVAVKVGDAVKQGDVIGTVGRGKSSDKPSLHFELRIDGEAYNPRYYLDS